ncbi:hypothetical protein JW890_04805 [candidate division WOR-3 bacterium]|nr:hypothetical protein [candidate division WOR-3 bacterium]
MQQKLFYKKFCQSNDPYEINDWDKKTFLGLICTDLTKKEKEIILNPTFFFSEEKTVLALHWHPENVPLDMVKLRLQKMFPLKETELIIPTQHNSILSYDDYCGVEVDCFSKEFNRKVQLLLHFRNNEKIRNSNLAKMIDHTFKYRASQFFQYMDMILHHRNEDILNKAAEKTGSDHETIKMVKSYTLKLKIMIDKFGSEIPKESLKNKLLSNYFISLKEHFSNQKINKCLSFLYEIKITLKKIFSLEYFFRVQEIIEEARLYNGGIIVPHPEQFWPILLADYDVDGYEVWNPQSKDFTQFLTETIIKKNRSFSHSSKKLLPMMGDDTHLGEKFKDPEFRDPEKSNREIGYQPAWKNEVIKFSLDKAGFTKERVLNEYLNRLNG